jgi:hypothetical protein
MRLYELASIESIGTDRFRVLVRCANQGRDCGQVEVSGDDLLDYHRFRRRVFDALGIVFSLVPDERFHRPTTSPLGLPILPREWDAAVQQAFTAATCELQCSTSIA